MKMEFEKLGMSWSYVWLRYYVFKIVSEIWKVDLVSNKPWLLWYEFQIENGSYLLIMSELRKGEKSSIRVAEI